MDLKIKKSELALTDTEYAVLKIFEIRYEDMSARDIHNYLVIDWNIDIDERKVRQIKHSLIFKGHPLGSSFERGYFYIRNEKDLKDAQGTYISHAKTELQVANKLALNVAARENLFPEFEVEQFEIISTGGSINERA